MLVASGVPGVGVRRGSVAGGGFEGCFCGEFVTASGGSAFAGLVAGALMLLVLPTRVVTLLLLLV